jgi:hypothetical protein
MDFPAGTGKIYLFPSPNLTSSLCSSPAMRRVVLLITLLVATLAWAGFLVIAIRLMS